MCSTGGEALDGWPRIESFYRAHSHNQLDRLARWCRALSPPKTACRLFAYADTHTLAQVPRVFLP
jgi:hypothetical protein